jgi:hypothetical protein
MAWRGDMSKSEEVVAMAKTRCREKEIAFALALVEIVREHPLLAHEAREEVLGTKLEILDSDRRTWLSSESFGRAGEDLVTTAKKRAREKSISFREALSEIGRENGELVRRVREETLGTNRE